MNPPAAPPYLGLLYWRRAAVPVSDQTSDTAVSTVSNAV